VHLRRGTVASSGADDKIEFDKKEHRMNEGKLANRVALVTGASPGIGRSIATILGREGAKFEAVGKVFPKGCVP
jgi:hypothetical protein